MTRQNEHLHEFRQLKGSLVTDEVYCFLQDRGKPEFLPMPHYDPRACSASNKNEYQKIFLEDKARPVRKAYNLAAISEPIV
jgi:hypothetical protein